MNHASNKSPLELCIEQLRNMTKEEFEQRKRDKHIEEKYYHKHYPEFEVMPVESSSFISNFNFTLEDLGVNSLNASHKFYNKKNNSDNNYPNSAA